MSLSSDSEPSEEWWLLRGGHGALVSRHEGTLDQLREGHSGPYLWTLRVLDWLPWSGSLWREMLLTAGLQGAEYAKSEYNLRNFYLDSTKEGSGD